MEQKNHRLHFMAISGWALALVLLCVSIANGTWQSATANPPGDNLSAPINVGSSAQTKSGAFTLNGTFSATSNSLFGGTATFTPSVDSTSTFKVTNAAGDSMININSTAGTSTIGPLNLTGVVGSLLGTGAKLNVGNSNSTYNLDVTGTARATDNIRSDAGFCIATDCITSWPSGGTPDGNVPLNGIILGENPSDASIIAGGYTYNPADTVLTSGMNTLYIYTKTTP